MTAPPPAEGAMTAPGEEIRGAVGAAVKVWELGFPTPAPSTRSVHRIQHSIFMR